MAFATGGFHGTRYIKEEEYGVTPLNPEMRNLRHTSNSLVLSKESFQSQELRSDAQISDLRHGNRQASGDIGIEFSFEEYDEILAAAVRSEWKDNEEIPGQKVLIAGTKMTSFTIERVFADIGQYENFTGCEINSLSLTIQPNAIVTGTIGIVGSAIHFTQEPLDPDPKPSYTYPPYDGFKGKLVEGGAVNSVVTSMELSIENSIEPAFVIGSDVAEALTAGRINVTGTISAYFENMDLLRKFSDEIETSIQITLGDGVHESYVITLPRVKYSGGDNPVDSEGPVTLSMPFQALYDECSGTNIRIDKIPPAVIAPCVMEYSDEEFVESSETAGTFDDTIVVSLTGGSKQKNFNGTIGQSIPGVVFKDVPEGLVANAVKLSASSAGISLVGTATETVTDTTMTVEFTPTSLLFGYCHCPDGEIQDSTKEIAIKAASGGEEEPDGPEEPGGENGEEVNS